MRSLMIPAATTVLLTTAACEPATLGITAAGMVLDALVDPGQAAASQAPNVMEALSGLDDSVSQSCLAMIDGEQPGGASKDVEVETRAGNTSVPVATAEEAKTNDVASETELVADASSDGEQSVVTGMQTNIAMSSRTEKVCSVQPVCLPGNSFPVEMMMCSDVEVTTAQAEAAPASVPSNTTWAWTEGDENVSP